MSIKASICGRNGSRTVVLLAVICGATVAGFAVPRPARPKPAPMTPWQAAEQARGELEAIPEGQRSKAAYTKVLDQYRAIYHEHPGDRHAAEAVFATGELLVEQGRSLNDQKSWRAAVKQFEWLRTQYPGSGLRIPALLAEGIIAQKDLQDSALAKQRYEELLKRYPRSQQAADAKAGLAELRGEKPHRSEEAAAAPVVPARGRVKSAPVEQAAVDAPPAPVRAPGSVASRRQALAEQPMVDDAPRASALPATKPTQMADDVVPAPVAVSPVAASDAGPTDLSRRGKLASVTGIRHWSTPNYTRVAIDLGDEVKYEAARVPNPDRIFFDLHGAKLAHELAGKSFAVTDDGFLKKIRAAQYSNDVTRVVLDVNDVTEYSAFLLPNPYRLIIDIHGGPKTQGAPVSQAPMETQPVVPQAVMPPPVETQKQEMSSPRNDMAETSLSSTPSVPSTVATKIRTTQSDVAQVSLQPGKMKATSVPTSQPIAANVKPALLVTEDDVPAPPAETKKNKKGKKNAVPTEDVEQVHAAQHTAAGETSLVRALGLKINRIVIDAGHGGHDVGTLGVDGIMEKDVVLDVALRLGKALHERTGAEIIYTRSDDTFIPLETRTAIANKAQADLFLSIHANSSQDDSARGVETYYLNFTSQPDALDVAARENAVSNQSIHQLSDLVKKITLKDKIEESREFALDVQQGLYAGLQRGNDGLKDRGVKKAPFVVLIGANMPSILAEISFVTNPKDAAQLRQSEYRQRVAESLYRGVVRYTSGLSGIKLASSNTRKTDDGN